MHTQLEDRKLQLARVNQLAVVVILLCTVLIARLWYLQIAQGEALLKQAESNRIKLLRTRAPRGTVYDRKGVILATSRPQFVVMAVPEKLRQNPGALRTLCGILEITSADIDFAIEKSHARPGSPVRLAVDVPMETVARIGELRMKLPGVSVELDNLRFYPDGAAVAHIMGYLGEIAQTQYDEAKAVGKAYNPGDYVGKAGIEKQYEDVLRGKDGGKQVEVNAFGRVIRVVREVQSIQGKDLYLTIDRDLQLAAHKAMGNQTGACVALNPKTGAVLAMISTPDYDPNLFVKRLRKEDWERIQSKKALQNRAVYNCYPPGSTFKPMMSIAGLVYGECNLRTTVSCPGYYNYGGTRRCWKVHGGGVDFNRAIAESCNVWFYSLAVRLGVDRIAKIVRQFGFGSATGIDLPNESRSKDGSVGIMPDTAWKKERFKNNPAQQKWFPGETPSVGIGQGYVQASPLQMAVVSAALATSGVRYRPYLADHVVDQNNREVSRTKPEIVGKVNAAPEHFEMVKKAMHQTVTAGTGRTAAVEGVTAAAKTGSAQNPHGIAHGWFICYAPVEDSEIAVAAIVEQGGHGSTTAGPVCRAVLDVYFGKKKVEEIEPRVPRAH